MEISWNVYLLSMIGISLFWCFYWNYANTKIKVIELSRRDKDVINVCLKTTLAITNGDTDGARKGKKDIRKTMNNFKKCS